MSWTKLAGAGQSGILNINGLVRYNGHWYMLSTDYRLNEFGGGSYDYMFSEVQDIQSMRRVHRGGPFRIIRYPDSTQWIDGNARGGIDLIVYKDKIYFATRDYSVLPSIYYTRVWRFDPRAGIGTLQNIHTVALASADCYDAWPNDMCIHNDKLFIGCCDRVIRFDGTTWTDLDPFPLSFDERDSNGAYNDFVSMCSFNDKLYLSAGTYGRGYPDTYYDQFRIMVSDNDGLSWSDVTVWNENQYSVEYGDQWMAYLTPFNGNIYMSTDFESVNNCKIYKLVGGSGSPQLVIEDHSHKYRMYSRLFTTRYDGDYKMYIGSYNSIKSMDVGDNVTTELSIKPYHPTYFINGHCDDAVTAQFAYVGGNIGWVSSVNPVTATNIYYSVAYSKDFSAYPIQLPTPVLVVIPLPIWIDPGEPPINPIDPPIDVEDMTNSSVTLTLKSIVVVTTTDAGDIVVSPETVGLQLSKHYIVCVSVPIIEADVVSLNPILYDAHGTVTDAYTHLVDVLEPTLEINPLTIVTQTLAGGSTCKALWNFESGALNIDSQGHNDLTDNYYVSESTEANGYKRGSCAALFDANLHQSFQIPDVDLDYGFPLKVGDSKKTITTCFWMKPTAVNLSGAKRIFSKYNYEDLQCSLGITQYLSKIRIYWGTGSSAPTYTTTAPTMVAGQWYHVGVVVDGINKSLTIRMWDDTAQTAHDFSATPTSELYVGPADVAIGVMPDQSDNEYYGYGGTLDELVVFDSLLTSDDIDAIRANGISTFGDPATFVSVEQDLTSFTLALFEPEVVIVTLPDVICNADLMSLTSTLNEVDIISNCTHSITEVDLVSLTTALNEVDVAVVFHLAVEVDLVSLTTAVYAASIKTFNIFTEDSSCKAVWKFESSALTADSQGTNTLTAYNSASADTSIFKRGTSSVDLPWDSDYNGGGGYLRIANADLDTGFPGKAGDTNKKISICGWVYVTHLDNPLTDFMGYINLALHDSDQLGLQFGFSSYYRLQVVYNQVQYLPTNMRFYANEWYHVALVVDGIAKTMYARFYRASTDAVLEWSDTADAEWNINDRGFTFGGHNDSGAGGEGGFKLDEVVAFDRLLSASEIDTIRDETFGNDMPDVTVSIDLLSEEASLYDVVITTTSIVEMTLLNIQSTINEVSTAFSATGIAELVHILLSPKRVTVVSPTDTVRITGLGIGLGLDLSM